MKLIKLAQADKFANSDECFGVEYVLNEPAVNISIIKVKGRYPAENFVVNEVSKEICYVLSGGGKIFKKGGEVLEFTKKDVLFMDCGEAYYWDADCEMAVICAPAWREEQHREVE